MTPPPSSTGSPSQASSTPCPSSLPDRKRVLRERLVARRRERAGTEEKAWAACLLELVARTVRLRTSENASEGAPGGGLESTTPLTIAAYLPTPWEPPLRAGLAALAACGHRILAPISLPRHRLDWAAWTPGTPERLTRFGVAEPEGPLLGPEAFRDAQLRLVPALAVDAAGVRLGYGGGFYDVALASGGSGRTVGVVFREELLPAGAVPAEPHDARLLEVLTEEGLFRPDGAPVGRD